MGIDSGKSKDKIDAGAARRKDKLESILNDISTHEDKIEELAELLEGAEIVNCYPSMDQYHIFCQAYTIKLLQTYVANKDDREILFALFRLLDGYEDFATIKGLHEYYAKEAFGCNKRIKVWKDSDSSLSKAEVKIIKKMAERLMSATTNTENNHLNLKDSVIKELSERFPNGLPPKLPLPQPGYLSPPTAPKASQPLDINIPPVEELFPTGKEIVLIPGEIFELKVAILPREAVDAPLSFVSLDPSIVTVSTRGMLKAEKKPQKLLHNIKNSRFLGVLLGRTEKIGTDSQTVEIVIQAESGITASKPVIVDYTRGCYEPSVSDINDYVPDFRVSQKVRLVGDTEWKDYVNAKVGDKVEIQTEYRNTSRRSESHKNVMMRAALPADLKYVAGSTILYNGTYPNGAKPNTDTLATTGVNIGNYDLDANAYVRFTAEVTDTNLKCGNNTLVNWMRVTVDGVVLQDYASVIAVKESSK